MHTTGDLSQMYLVQRAELCDEIGHDYNAWNAAQAQRAAIFLAAWCEVFRKQSQDTLRLADTAVQLRKEVQRLRALRHNDRLEVA